jgi:hypothetical protein
MANFKEVLRAGNEDYEFYKGLYWKDQEVDTIIYEEVYDKGGDIPSAYIRAIDADGNEIDVHISH